MANKAVGKLIYKNCDRLALVTNKISDPEIQAEIDKINEAFSQIGFSLQTTDSLLKQKTRMDAKFIIRTMAK
jgi:hypothetical protein